MRIIEFQIEVDHLGMRPRILRQSPNLLDGFSWIWETASRGNPENPQKNIHNTLEWVPLEIKGLQYILAEDEWGRSYRYLLISEEEWIETYQYLLQED